MKYKVGDKVRVRQWDDMVEEFGVWAGAINTPESSFDEGMRLYCGTIVTIKEVKNNNSYYIEEDDEDWFWTDEMFEPYEDKKTRPIPFNKEAFDRLIKQLNKEPVIFAPKYDVDGCKVTTELIENIVKETREMVKKNIETEIKKKKVHPKDEDHLKRVEKIQKKIDYYKKESEFDLIEEVVPKRVVKATFRGKTFKMVCDYRDEFSMEKVLYLIIAKYWFKDTCTSEGIERKAEEFKYNKNYTKIVEQAMKMLAAMEDLEKENAEYEALLEARRQKRWERKQRQMDRRAEKKKAQEEKEREEKIQIFTEAFLRAIKAVKEEEKKEENIPVEEENTKAESKPEENMTETIKKSTEESTENTEKIATTTE